MKGNYGLGVNGVGAERTLELVNEQNESIYGRLK